MQNEIKFDERKRLKTNSIDLCCVTWVAEPDARSDVTVA